MPDKIRPIRIKQKKGKRFINLDKKYNLEKIAQEKLVELNKLPLFMTNKTKAKVKKEKLRETFKGNFGRRFGARKAYEINKEVSAALILNQQLSELRSKVNENEKQKNIDEEKKDNLYPIFKKIISNQPLTDEESNLKNKWVNESMNPRIQKLTDEKAKKAEEGLSEIINREVDDKTNILTSTFDNNMTLKKEEEKTNKHTKEELEKMGLAGVKNIASNYNIVLSTKKGKNSINKNINELIKDILNYESGNLESVNVRKGDKPGKKKIDSNLSKIPLETISDEDESNIFNEFLEVEKPKEKKQDDDDELINFYKNHEGLTHDELADLASHMTVKDKDTNQKYKRVKSSFNDYTDREILDFISENVLGKKLAQGLSQNMGVNIDDINDIMKDTPNFYGAIQEEQIDEIIEKIKIDKPYVFSFIVLVHNYMNGGTNHYVSYWCDLKFNKEFCYYDSYANDPDNGVLKKFKNLFENDLDLPFLVKLKYNKIANQSLGTDVCALHAMFYIYMRMFGFSHKQSTLYEDSEENDKRLLRSKFYFSFI